MPTEFSQVFSILSEKEFKLYRQLLRDFNDPDKDVGIDTVVEKVKVMFKDDDKFLVLKVRCFCRLVVCVFDWISGATTTST